MFQPLGFVSAWIWGSFHEDTMFSTQENDVGDSQVCLLSGSKKRLKKDYG